MLRCEKAGPRAVARAFRWFSVRHSRVPAPRARRGEGEAGGADGSLCTARAPPRSLVGEAISGPRDECLPGFEGPSRTCLSKRHNRGLQPVACSPWDRLTGLLPFALAGKSSHGDIRSQRSSSLRTTDNVLTLATK